jgi:hypothetical protein
MKIELKDLECYDEMYYIGHLVDVDGDGWVSENTAQKVLDKINQPEPTLSDKIDTPTLLLIVIIMIALLNSLTSCTGTKIVYHKGSEWQPMGSRSAVTGWSYK